jgi:HlyD family secretion protein
MRGMTAADVLEREMEAVLPAPSLRRVGVAAAAALVLGAGGLVGWAAATSLDSAVITAGSLAAEGRRKSINLLEPGILREMLVREGERVVPGQPLLRLDTTQAETAAHQARGAYWGQRIRAARLAAEQADARNFELPLGAAEAGARDPAINALILGERRLFQARWAAFDGAIGVQRTRVAQSQEQLQAMIALRIATSTRLRSTREELAGVNTLVRQGFATRTRQWELQRNEAELLGQLGQYQAQESQTREQIVQAEAEMANLLLNRQQDVARELQDAIAAAASVEQQLRSLLDVLNRREVTSPEAGIVTDIRVVTAGSSIAAGQAILDLVPVDDRLIAEIRISPTDVENVRIGQPARVRLSAFRTADAPMLEARVIYVSADQRLDERGSAHFAARIEMVTDVLQSRPDVQLASGMPVEAYILGERRSALDYIVRPLRDSLRRSLRD